MKKNVSVSGICVFSQWTSLFPSSQGRKRETEGGREGGEREKREREGETCLQVDKFLVDLLASKVRSELWVIQEAFVVMAESTQGLLGNHRKFRRRRHLWKVSQNTRGSTAVPPPSKRRLQEIPAVCQTAATGAIVRFREKEIKKKNK